MARGEIPESAPLAPAPPFVSYSTMSQATVPAEAWVGLYPALQAFKGHVQEYPGCQAMEIWVRAAGDDVLVHCYTTWDAPSQLEAFLERGYTFERMLADVAGLEASESLLMEKIF